MLCVVLFSALLCLAVLRQDSRIVPAALNMPMDDIDAVKPRNAIAEPLLERTRSANYACCSRSERHCVRSAQSSARFRPRLWSSSPHGVW